jgi:chromate reductase
MDLALEHHAAVRATRIRPRCAPAAGMHLAASLGQHRRARASWLVRGSDRARRVTLTARAKDPAARPPMAEFVRILGLAGSLRKNSYNRGTLRAAGELMPPDSALDVFDIAGLPGFNQDEEGHPPAQVVELKSAIRRADGLLFVTPEYNYSVPGVLKNAIDWASRPYGDSAWAGKPAAIMGASVGAIGTARAQYHLRQMFVFLDIHPVNQPEVMIGKAGERFDQQGNLTDDTTRELIRKLLASLVDWTRRLKASAQR